MSNLISSEAQVGFQGFWHLSVNSVRLFVIHNLLDGQFRRGRIRGGLLRRLLFQTVFYKLLFRGIRRSLVIALSFFLLWFVVSCCYAF